jgi:hypothetical protein
MRKGLMALMGIACEKVQAFSPDFVFDRLAMPPEKGALPSSR